jgi:hypothetical protein
MIAAAEDPFAIHLIIQSADKLLIDLSKRLKKPLTLDWAENIKDECRSPLMAVFRETYNFLKHADNDYDAELHVGSIAESNVLQLAACIANYYALFGETTDHMNLLFISAKLVFSRRVRHAGSASGVRCRSFKSRRYAYAVWRIL